MKILVTGGAGFIGSAVVRRAIADGHHVVNLDALTYAACLDSVAPVADHPGYAFEHADTPGNGVPVARLSTITAPGWRSASSATASARFS